MELLYLFIITSVLDYHYNLHIRIKKCEQLLDEIKAPSTKIPTSQNPESVPPSPVLPKIVEKFNSSKEVSAPLKTPLVKTPLATIPKVIKVSDEKESSDEKVSLTEKVSPKEPFKTPAIPKEPFKIPAILKENWMGIIGSIALVIGLVLFSLTSEIMEKPEARTTAIIAASLFIFWISLKLNNQPHWILLCSWLRSIAGTVILFATIGAGSIEGLQFIYSPIYALAFLCAGIAVNLVLASLTNSESVASLHVILAIIAFCLAPQTLILLPMGALVATIGLMIAYRAKWDLHLLLIVIAFSGQNFFWTYELKSEFLPWKDFLAIACSLIVGLFAGLMHYSKKYKSPTFEMLPFAAHIMNWGLLILNIWIHAQFSHLTPLILGTLALAGFILAKAARKRKLIGYTSQIPYFHSWQPLPLLSVWALLMSPLDVCLLIIFETMVFSLVFQFQKEQFLIRAGYCCQYIASLFMLFFSIETLHASATPFTVYLRMGAVTALSWGYYLYSLLKKFVIDDYRFILFNERDLKNPVSLSTVIGSLFLLVVYTLGFDSVVVQSLVFIAIAMIVQWRKNREDPSSNIALAMTWGFVHLLTYRHLFILCFQGVSVPSILSNICFPGIIVLDLYLITGNLVEFKMWKKDFRPFLVYALGLQTGLLIDVFTRKISLLIPGLAFLGFACLTLGIVKLLPRWLKGSHEVKQKMDESIIQVGIAFLVLFLVQFMTVHLQTDLAWHGMSLNWITEALGLSVILYWIACCPRNANFSQFTKFLLERFLDVCLGFITLCVVIEVPELWRLFLWGVLAIGLFSGSRRYNWPKRLYAYSWIYFIGSIGQLAFVTSTLTMSNLFSIEKSLALIILAIALQFYYAYIVHGKEGEIEAATKTIRFISIIFHHSNLTVLLPVFVGVALLFAFNFEKSFLTLTWVGLICIYLSTGLVIKSKRSIQIGMTALIFCSGRLIFFDLVQKNLSIRALVFIGVGGLMLGISALYKKYKHRIEIPENI